MTYRGHVKNGQIMLDEAIRLPEGAGVYVQVVDEVPQTDSQRQLAALEAFAVGMDKLRERLPPGHEIDDSRETIYEGRGG
jgi:hypothetical protein